jgi:hypothetical protein
MASVRRTNLTGILLCFGLVLVCVSGYATQQSLPTLKPIDEAPSKPDFLAFRKQLQNAIAKHDVAAVLAVVDPNIKNSFDADDGIEAFKEKWRPSDPGSQLWKELGNVLSLGGSFDGTQEFTAPYTFSRWPQDVDAFEFVAVIGSNVRVRNQPRSDAPSTTSVSYAILQLDEEALNTDWMNKEWTAVKVGGRKSYIATRLVRSPVDYRARFTRSARGWQLTLFLNGD